MVDFRRWITVLAVLALFAGVAAAQNCTAQGANTNPLRAEGYTEQAGDIVLLCSGGNAQAAGSVIQPVTIQIFFTTLVTSRLLPSSSVANLSEALLLIDEPGGQGPQGNFPAGFGPSAPQILCTTPLQGCQEFVNNLPPSTPNPNAATVQVAVGTVGATTSGPNVFQGLVSANSVTFFGVPILGPVTTGLTRTIRITNIRVNANALSGSSAAGVNPLIASILVTGSSSLTLSNPTPTVGFIQQSLSASHSGTASINQCVSVSSTTSVSLLTFKELFGAAFKTRVNPLGTPASTGAGQASNATGQNVPAQTVTSESDFIFPVSTASTQPSFAGLADFGTRLKATFSNVPNGVSLFVSVNNVKNSAVGVTAPAGDAVGGNTIDFAFAQLVSSETSAEGSLVGTNGLAAGTVPTTQVVIDPTTHSGSAVWEVLNSTGGIDTLNFAVFVSSTANVSQNLPFPGTAAVNLSYGPAGLTPGFSTLIPRFTVDTSVAPATNIFVVNLCHTVLLYPFVTTNAGFDTGLAIANTSTDVFGTGPQSGACSLNCSSGRHRRHSPTPAISPAA